MRLRDSGVRGLEAVGAASSSCIAWLHDHALPLWDLHGVDRVTGGYFEELTASQAASSIVAVGATRRGRVVARQIYVFDVGHRLGWRSVAGDPVAHGSAYLFQRMRHANGSFHTAIDGATHTGSGEFSLYEQAFYLFALARLHQAGVAHPTAEVALSTLDTLRREWACSAGGFEETRPPSEPLKSNPHMHMLEAALEWIDATTGNTQNLWISLARELVDLCLRRFIAPSSGALHEYFDRRWARASGELGRIVEPGHQFEWTWLLLRWAALPHADAAEREECRAAASRLIEVGERGVDASRGVAMNELWDDLSPKDASAKLWPQTERIKAWCAMVRLAKTEDEVARAHAGVLAAVAGLRRYFRVDPRGLWYESMAADGTLALCPTKASSLYHIVCAIDVLRQTVETAEPGDARSPPGFPPRAGVATP